MEWTRNHIGPTSASQIETAIRTASKGAEHDERALEAANRNWNDRLREAVSCARLPFPAADRYECWLLDSSDASPLALLHSCVDAQDMALVPTRAVWVAMPAAQLDVQAPKTDQNAYVPPVNYRLQKLVEQRAGPKPRAAWFERPTPATDAFPPCLIREDWDTEERQQLCELYIRRLAPRLRPTGRPDRHRSAVRMMSRVCCDRLFSWTGMPRG